MVETLRFDGQVAIVTGAGSGIGRAIALALAHRGAKVLVNDVGTAQGEAGVPTMRATAVVSEIVQAGGKAIADLHPIGAHAQARAVVQAALDAFGRVDILVNNAGVAVTGKITSHPDEAVDRVIDINLHGAFAMMRAVWAVMTRQRYGRILSMSSNAAFGIGLNAPYALTKAGLMGLTLDAAQEGAPLGIHVNALMPLAYTPMADGIPDAEFLRWLQTNCPPAKVAQVAAFLLHGDCNVNGRILSTGGGYVAAMGFVKGPGFVDRDLTAEVLRDNIDTALNLAGGKPILQQSDEMKSFFDVFPWTGSHAKEHMDLSDAQE